MSNATLAITVTLTNGGVSRSAELSMLDRCLDLVKAAVGGANGTATSGTVYGDGATNSPVSATYTYTPVASK